MNLNQYTRPLAIKEAAAILGIGRHRLAKAIRAGQIPSIQVGARYLIPPADLHRLLEPPSDKPESQPHPY